MNKQTTLFVIIGILITALFGYWFSVGNVSNNNDSVAFNQKLKNQSVTKQNSDLCKKAQGYTFEARDYTDKISAQEAKNHCYRHYAEETKNIQVCEKISKDEIYARCVLETQQSMGEFSEKHCDKINSVASEYSPLLSSCADSLARQTKDKSICDKYFKKHTGFWNGCVFESGNDPSEY